MGICFPRMPVITRSWTYRHLQRYHARYVEEETSSRSYPSQVFFGGHESKTILFIVSLYPPLDPDSQSSSFHHSSEKASPRPSVSRRRERIPSFDLHCRPSPVQHLPIAFYTSPHIIRTLPPEILAYIFILGSEDDPMLPLHVGQVCRFFRYLAFDTPSLWRRVILGSHYSLWRETMHRARACTLDIEFKSPNRHSPLAFYEVQRYMHLVVPHIRRWRSLRIMFSDYQPYLWNSALSECCGSDTRVPGESHVLRF